MIEIVKGNERYRRYLAAELFTSLWHLVELYLAVLREHGDEGARRQFVRFRPLCVEVPDDWIFEAMALKLSRSPLSYADAIGYAAARRLGARFLTGDEEFRRMPDVEFRR